MNKFGGGKRKVNMEGDDDGQSTRKVLKEFSFNSLNKSNIERPRAKILGIKTEEKSLNFQ